VSARLDRQLVEAQPDPSHDLLHRAQKLGIESRVQLDDHASLKLWLRLLACTTQVETEIRRRLRRQFGISLARFDYMAQLYRHREGLKMKALSRCLMVTGGNVTGLTDELERDELVVREQDPADRRSSLVRLTAKGRRVFETMAKEHELWILELLGSLDAEAVQQLYHALGKLRVQMVGNSL
jgi:DNA-binding MarR family transcriptional regulator